MPRRDKEQRGRKYDGDGTRAGEGSGWALEGRLRITPVFTWAKVAGFEATQVPHLTRARSVWHIERGRKTACLHTGGNMRACLHTGLRHVQHSTAWRLLLPCPDCPLCVAQELFTLCITNATQSQQRVKFCPDTSKPYKSSVRTLFRWSAGGDLWPIRKIINSSALMTISGMFSVEPVAARLLIWWGTLIKSLKIELCGHVCRRVNGFFLHWDIGSCIPNKGLGLAKENQCGRGKKQQNKMKERRKRHWYLKWQELSEMGVDTIFFF